MEDNKKLLMPPKVSIIIPVYNVEAYIERCIRSLFSQTLDSMEFIFIDDCSPDRSIELIKKILDEYPHRKPQTKIVQHKFNKGVSQSRQDGLDLAAGEYVIHCDPDDYVCVTMFEVLYLKAKESNADIVLCDYIKKGEKDKYCSAKPKNRSSKSLLEQISGVSKQYIMGGLCNKLINSKIAHSGKFVPGISYCEDALYLFTLLKADLKIEYVQKPFYFYCISRTDSLVKTVNENAFKSDVLLFKKLLELDYDNLSEYKCYKCFLGRIILDRLFLYELKQKSQSLLILQQYKRFVFLSSRDSLLKKILVYGALAFNYDVFEYIYMTLLKIKKRIRNN